MAVFQIIALASPRVAGSSLKPLTQSPLASKGWRPGLLQPSLYGLGSRLLRPNNSFKPNPLRRFGSPGVFSLSSPSALTRGGSA